MWTLFFATVCSHGRKRCKEKRRSSFYENRPGDERLCRRTPRSAFTVYIETIKLQIITQVSMEANGPIFSYVFLFMNFLEKLKQKKLQIKLFFDGVEGNKNYDLNLFRKFKTKKYKSKIFSKVTIKWKLQLKSF